LHERKSPNWRSAFLQQLWAASPEVASPSTPELSFHPYWYALSRLAVPGYYWALTILRPLSPHLGEVLVEEDRNTNNIRFRLNPVTGYLLQQIQPISFAPPRELG
jgi:hypothetical protein